MRMWMNSKYVEEGDYFLVDKNNKKYVSDAIKNGAVKIISEVEDTFNIETVKVDSVKDYLFENYKEKINNLKLIGITGTNGKTTTCYLIYQMLNMMGVKTCYIGTIGFYINDKMFSLNNTTPSIDLLYNILDYAYEQKNEVVVMEVSSHALKQERIYGLLYDAIGVTNITLDHMDYHKIIDDYISSKKKLLKLTKNNKICILNKNDKYYKRFIENANNNIAIGKHIKVKKIIKDIDKTYLKLKQGNEQFDFEIKLVGDFNVYNFIMAWQIVTKLGYNIPKEKLLLLEEPKGRMQKVIYNNNVIFIDYAHTPDAVLNVLKTVRSVKNKGIITIVGCGGNRDKTKRSIMAKIACKYSSYVIFTNDNPRDEDEQEIIKDMLCGAKGSYEVIYNRFEAIKKGISMLDNNKILMILGKGHEEYQIIKGEKHYFSDFKSVNKILDNLNKK